MKIFLATLAFGLLIASGIFFSNMTGAVVYKEPVYEEVSPQRFAELMTGDVEIIDIRTLEEYYSGIIQGAVNIDYYSTSFREELSQLDKDKTYLIYCRTGSRTSNAVGIMRELGFNEVYVLKGGITSWRNTRLPISSPF